MAKKGSKSGKKNFKKFWKITLIVLISLFGLSLLMPIIYIWVNPPITITMISRYLFEDEPIKKEWVPIEEISPYMAQAAVAAEDNYFLAHNGFDFIAIKKAMEINKKGKKKLGGSTISQQTAKNVFLSQNRTWLRKGLEVYYTFLIETFWSKERIMEVYLNVIEMGHGIYGVEAAAEEYFNTSAKKLTKHQAALITVTYPNPRRWNAGNPTPYIQKRAGQIENLMSKIGKINFDDESIKKAEERFEKHKEKFEKENKK